MAIRDISKRRRFFSLTACLVLIISTLLVGISINIPNASAGSVDHIRGNLDVEMLTDYGRILMPLDWGGTQTVQDDLTLAFIGLVVDHDNYDHTPGAENISDCFDTYPYMGSNDFTTVNAVTMIIDDAVTQKSFGSFQNTDTATGFENDILINQTAWTVVNKDWAILQWTLTNVKTPATTLTNVRIGLEVPISKVGGRFGLGGSLIDGGDDIDDYDGTNDVYWAQDTGDLTTIGFGSAIDTDPITHYFAEDYQVDYSTQYVNFFASDSWLYQRISAPSATATDGVNPENITATVGWDGFNIASGDSRTVTLVIAINNSYNNMINAIKDAQFYYQNVATNFQITEIRDSGSASARVEVFNNGRKPLTNPDSLLTLTSTSGTLTGSWSNDPIPTYGYSYLDVSMGSINAEGDTITLLDNGVQVDQVSFGQVGIAPDPVADESVARRFDTSSISYSNDWLRDPSPTWNSQNDVGNIITSPLVVINRVLFNPFGGDPEEGYVELMYTGFAPMGINIQNYRIVCDDVYLVPSVTLYPTDRFYVFTYSDMSAFFTDPNGMTPAGDNVYLYNFNDDLLDMVGWSSAHNQGEFMSRSPDGFGTYQGYNDATSITAGWVFDQTPSLMLTEFYADSGAATIELFNPRGGDKVLSPRWTLDVTGGTLSGNWNNPTINWKGYETFSWTPGVAPGNEGDTISLYYQVTNLMDQVAYGTSGVAPDPLSGESTARYWDSTLLGYTNDWNRDATDTFGAQNDVPPINSTSFIIMNEVMFNPTLDPDGKYVILINIMPNWIVNISNFILVCDDAYQLPSYPTAPGGFDGNLGYLWTFIIRYGDDSPASDNFFQNMDASGDNVYLYDSNGVLLDMVGWNNPFSTGMSVRRVPDGFGTYQGYNDATSQAAGWVFNTPLQVFVTEISDSGSSPIEIEVYNPWYPTIDFTDISYTFENSLGFQITGNWPTGSAGAGQYAHFQRSGGGSLAAQGDTLSFKHNTVLIEEVSYGTYGTVPDPLPSESVERYWDGNSYTDVWERNWVSGSNFGAENDVPPANFSSAVVLNEIMFYPNVPADGFVELFLRYGMLNISGYKIVGNTEHIIPMGTILTQADPFFYLMEAEDPGFFGALVQSGDNIYLYDDNGSLLDRAGWSSLHDQGKTMCRIPDGNGTRNGFNDVSSTAAGWVFNTIPSIQFVKLALKPPTRSKQYGSLGSIMYFNLTITNKQTVDDTVTISNSTVNGYPIVIYDETGTFIITEIFVPAGQMVNISVMVILPSVVPFIGWDNISIIIQSQNVSLFMDVIKLQAVITPFIMPEKYVNPSEIYLEGTGHDEISTITLNLTGMGAILELVQPQDVIFCVDVSGSMTSQAIQVIIQGLNGYVDEMDKPDRGAVVLFGGGGALLPVLLMNNLTDDYSQLRDDINAIPDPPMGPSTPMGDGMNTSIDELLINGNASNIRVIILLTDGINNAGTHNPIIEANNAAFHNITIFTIGLSTPDNWTLQQIATITGGQYFYAPSVSDIPGIYKIIAAYVGDIAGRDTITTDANPMIRDVLPPWIQLVPGTFTLPPETNYINATGYRILEWNLSSLGIGKSWEVSFQVKSTMMGWVRANDLDASRVYYEDQFGLEHYVLFPETRLNVLPGIPLPPKLKIDILPNKDDIILSWDERLSPVTEKYLIYRASSPTDFDFSTPWVDTNSSITGVDPVDLLVIPLRTTWNHTGAADPNDALEYSEQWYYCIRSVNTRGEVSRTSRTVGKWTKEFLQGGASTFSLPLEPIETMTPTADFFVNDMGANFIKWMDLGSNQWNIHGGPYVNDTLLEVGKGYEVDFPSPTKYTFLGMPGSMIRYNSLGFIGFDSGSDAKLLLATVNPVSGDVTLSWPKPTGMNFDDSYKVYYSTIRDGFDGIEGTDYILLPGGTILYDDPRTIVHSGATLLFDQLYYMVTSENETGAEGTSTYSLGVWTADYPQNYDTIGIPLNLGTFETADWYCDQIDNTVGINFYKNSVVGWSWHSTRMPAGAFDPTLIMTDGYQISTSGPTRYTFIGH